MTYETKDGTGALFKNDKGSDNHPDYKGNIKVAGREYELAAWIRESKKGNKYMSLKVSEPWSRERQAEATQNEQPSGGPDLSDEIPFAPHRGL